VYRSFTIRNFRCFSDLTVEPLERVNLIAGKNNVGKTALLEALLLRTAPNNPDLPVSLSRARGLGRYSSGLRSPARWPAPNVGRTERTGRELEEIWGWLFYERRTQATVRFTVGHRDSLLSSVLLRLEPQEALQLPLPGDEESTPYPEGSLGAGALPMELVIEYEDTRGRKGASRASIGTDGLRIHRSQVFPLPVTEYLTTRPRSPSTEAERFSGLQRVGREDEVVDVLRILEPRLRRLVVDVVSGSPAIAGDVGIGQLVPLQLMGEGTVRLLSVLLAVAGAPGGVVLVDEIENGLHHSVLEGVWKAIGEATRRSNVQVFTTTHSWECIEAAHRAFSASGSYDFRLHRLDRVNDHIRSVTYDQEMLAAAIATDLEVR
jgi:hypothetical protein